MIFQIVFFISMPSYIVKKLQLYDYIELITFQDCKTLTYNSSFPTCGENEFRCLNRFYCIHNSWLCDGDNDCPDGSDESVDQCGNMDGTGFGSLSQVPGAIDGSPCRTDQFQCDSGQCIPGHLQCSGKPECHDESDEKQCRKYK